MLSRSTQHLEHMLILKAAFLSERRMEEERKSW